VAENAHESPDTNRSRNGAEQDTARGAGVEQGPAQKGHRSDEVRVGAVEAAVAAGLVPASEPAEAIDAPLEKGRPSQPDRGYSSLPDWTDPPTGQVPKVLLDEGEEEVATRPRGPSWRQTSADWQVDEDTLDFLIEIEPEGPESDETSSIAGRGEDPSADIAPFDFDFSPTRRRRRRRDLAAVPERSDTDQVERRDHDAWDEVVNQRPPRPRRHKASHRSSRATPGPGSVPPRRNAAVAITTGVIFGGLAVACFEAGPATVMAFAALVLGLAGGETLGALRRAGYQPVALVALVAVPVIVVTSYLKGAVAVPIVLAAVVIAAGVWRLFVTSPTSSVDDVSVTVLVVGWIGVPGAFAGLMLNPTTFPLRHGVAYVGAALALTVVHDICSYFFGSKLGRHRLIPRVSPGKTVEGLLGGTIATLIVAGAVVALVHPFTVASAIGLGVIVCVFAPLGDLVESVVKRDLGLKDMGRLLPAHGGISDRIDAMLFVLPATYVLVRLVHIG